MAALGRMGTFMRHLLLIIECLCTRHAILIDDLLRGNPGPPLVDPAQPNQEEVLSYGSIRRS